MSLINVIRKVQFVALLAYASFLSLAPDPGGIFHSFWDKFLHVVCWMVLCLSLRLALRSDKWLYPASMGLFAYSVIIEGLQHSIPERHFSFFDIVANGCGVIIALILLLVSSRWLFPRLFEKASCERPSHER